MRGLAGVLLACLLPVTAAAQGCGGTPKATAQIITATNQFRAAQGLSALRDAPALRAAAEDHACDMARRNYFDHRGRNGSTPKTRARKQGYRACLIAENIAAGQISPARAFAAWIGSPGHRRNMELRDLRDIGVAMAPARNGRGPYWVMVLARPCR